MPAPTIYILEGRSSRNGSSSADRSTELTMEYYVHGSDDIYDLHDAVAAATPATLLDPVKLVALYRHDVEWQPNSIVLDDSLQNSWIFRLKYIDATAHDNRRQLDVGEVRLRCSTRGGLKKILVSKATKTKVAAGGANPRDFKQAIAVTAEGEVQGCEIVIPAMRFSLDFRHPNATITQAYFATVRGLTGKTNNATFYGQPAGSILFEGGDGDQASNSDPQWSYSFIGGENLAAQLVNGIGPFDANAHDYVWVYFTNEEQTLDGVQKSVRVPQAVYVERVYDAGDFSTLGIGTS